MFKDGYFTRGKFFVPMLKDKREGDYPGKEKYLRISHTFTYHKDGWMDRWIRGWIDGKMEGWIGVRMDKKRYGRRYEYVQIQGMDGMEYGWIRRSMERGMYM